MLPPINKKVSTLEAQHHCMTIIRDTIKFLNEKQVPVDVSDQPVFALSMEVQLRYPAVFGVRKYLCMLGDLHIEQSLLGMHGELIKGSGLDHVLTHANISTAGTSAIVDVNDIKRSRYCLQVALCSIYKLLKVAHENSREDLSLLKWLDKRCEKSQMAFYWRQILQFEIQVLVFLRSIREGNFPLYVETLFFFLKWYFALDKYNYSRWATLFWFQLASLSKTCPGVFVEFMKGNFSFPKTNAAFSRMALDQLHEQNNKVIKGVSGAVSVINRKDESALIRWALCAPELTRMNQEFEQQYGNICDDESTFKPHHESSAKFQIEFFKDVQRLFASFTENPFELQTLTMISDATQAFEENVFHNLSQLEPTGLSQLQTFINDRLILCKTPINARIRLNHFILPGDEKSKQSSVSAVGKRLSSELLTKLRDAINYRREQVQELFNNEILGFSQCLSINGDIYHGTKSNLLQRFETTDPPAPSASSALIIELSALMRRSFEAKSFDQFAVEVYQLILGMGDGYERIDVICDRYFEGSLKTLTRKGCGSGGTLNFDGSSVFPSDFKDNFMNNSSNKDRLYHFLADRLVELHSGSVNVTLVVTKGDGILTNSQAIKDDASISSCSPEEDDQKLVRHTLQCLTSNPKSVAVRTVDTDVLLL